MRTFQVIDSETGKPCSNETNYETASWIAKNMNRGTDQFRVVTIGTVEDIEDEIVVEVRPPESDDMKFEVRDVNSGEVKWSMDTFTEAFHAWQYEIMQTNGLGTDFEFTMGTA